MLAMPKSDSASTLLGKMLFGEHRMVPRYRCGRDDGRRRSNWGAVFLKYWLAFSYSLHYWGCCESGVEKKSMWHLDILENPTLWSWFWYAAEDRSAFISDNLFLEVLERILEHLRISTTAYVDGWISSVGGAFGGAYKTESLGYWRNIAFLSSCVGDGSSPSLF